MLAWPYACESCVGVLRVVECLVVEVAYGHGVDITYLSASIGMLQLNDEMSEFIICFKIRTLEDFKVDGKLSILIHEDDSVVAVFYP